MIANQVAGLLAPPYTAPAFSSDFESIQTYTVGSGGASSIEFTSIVGTYKHLQVRGIMRSSNGGTGWDYARLQVNTDTGSNYSRHALVGSSLDGAYATAASSTSYIQAGQVPQTSSTANAFGVTVIDFLDYSNVNKNKTIRSLNGCQLNNNDSYVFFNSGAWYSTSAITSIKIYPDSGSFSQYTQLALYGVK